MRTLILLLSLSFGGAVWAQCGNTSADVTSPDGQHDWAQHFPVTEGN